MTALINKSVVHNSTVSQIHIPTGQQTELQAAFFDMETGKIHASRYSDGKLAPIHLQDGLPAEVAMRLDINVISGFVMNGRFYTRKESLDLVCHN